MNFSVFLSTLIISLDLENWAVEHDPGWGLYKAGLLYWFQIHLLFSLDAWDLCRDQWLQAP